MASDISKELDILKKQALYLGSVVESNLEQAIRAILDNDPQQARAVRAKDAEIDRIEVSTEDLCLEILALHQPVAGDLRFLVTVLKINIDLERIGDLAAKMASKVDLLAPSPHSPDLLSAFPWVRSELDIMFRTTGWMLSTCLDAFAKGDAELAYKVLAADDRVDQAKNLIRSLLEESIRRDPTNHGNLSLLLSVCRGLERIADHATNICENIIYMLQGKIVRHKIDELNL